MKAAVGDKIAIMSRHLDETVRQGEIVEVHGADGDPPFVVRWSDTGHVGVLYPGPDARVQPADHAGTGLSRTEGGMAPARAKQWQVTVSVAEYESGETKAHVIAHTGLRALQAHGRARRLAGDVDVPQIGDEVAVGRAFVSLGEDLLDQAAEDIEEIEGHRSVIRRSFDGSLGDRGRRGRDAEGISESAIPDSPFPTEHGSD